MKKFLLFLVFMMILGNPAISAEKQTAKEHNPNPKNDPDVEQGYKEHQEEHRQKDTKENFTVHKSGEGHNGNPTSGGFAPSEIKKK